MYRLNGDLLIRLLLRKIHPMSDLSDLAVACNKILTLEKAIGDNRFVCTLPFLQIKPTDKSKFELFNRVM